MTVPFYTSTREYAARKDEFDSAVRGVMERGDFILGGEVAEFEREAAAWLGAKYAVGVASGLRRPGDRRGHPGLPGRRRGAHPHVHVLRLHLLRVPPGREARAGGPGPGDPEHGPARTPSGA